MQFAILRVQKLKSTGAIRRSLKHAFREQDTPNADPARTPENAQNGATSSQKAFDRVLAALPEKKRSNAVLAIEYLITASPEKMNSMSRAQQDGYFATAAAWLAKRHGSENLVHWGVHRDETTPHMYAYVVPMDDKGRLNCRAFLGGAKALSEMQTEFHNTVAREYGLERGVKGSKARHTTIRQYYDRVNKPIEKLPEAKLPESPLLEGKKDYGIKVYNALRDAVQPRYLQAMTKNQELTCELNKQKAENDRITAKLNRKNDVTDNLLKVLEPLAKLKERAPEKYEQIQRFTAKNLAEIDKAEREAVAARLEADKQQKAIEKSMAVVELKKDNGWEPEH